jgi:HEAT repeat protein
MSVKARDVSLKNLLSEIQEKSGIAIELKDSKAAERRSFIDFKNLLPALAFRTILRGLNFALFYSERRLARVLILPPGNRIAKSQSGLMNPNRFGRQVARAGNVPTRSGGMPNLTGKNSKDSHIATQLDAIEAMADSDDPKSIAALGDALTHRDSRVKEAAFQALEDKKEPNVTEMLRRSLNDADPEFRIAVLEILAHRGDLDSLRKALADGDQDVRETAADLLESTMPQK